MIPFRLAPLSQGMSGVLFLCEFHAVSVLDDFLSPLSFDDGDKLPFEPLTPEEEAELDAMEDAHQSLPEGGVA